MNIERLLFREMVIPFRISFAHASAERRQTESVWAEAHSSDGRVGFGEGCPRSYVTGESVRSAYRFFERHRSSLIQEVHALPDLVQFSSKNRADIDANPAAFAAIELALIDLFAKASDRSAEAILGVAELAGSFLYTAVVGSGSLDHFCALLDFYGEPRTRGLKLKVSGDPVLDRQKLAMAAAAGYRLRIDANNLWSSLDEAVRYIAALDAPLVGIEEPLPPNRYRDLASLAAQHDTRVILDESLLRTGQLDELAAWPERFVLNLRVSKLGGLLRSLEVINAARKLGIQIIVGAHVGETSLLTRAALTLASQAGDLLIAQEGAFGLHLLSDDVCESPLMFGAGGLLSAPEPGRGLGLAIRPDLPFFADAG